MNSRMNQFRGRTNKQEELQTAKNTSDVNHLFKMILALSQKVFALEAQMKDLFPVARIADWRSLALVKVLNDDATMKIHGLSLEDVVTHKAVALQTQAFDLTSTAEDKAKGLVACDDETAQNEYYAIVRVKVFKDTKELEDQQIVRAKIELGSNELFPELDEALIGMKVGETKNFPLNLVGQTDEGQVELLGLRKKA